MYFSAQPKTLPRRDLDERARAVPSHAGPGGAGLSPHASGGQGWLEGDVQVCSHGAGGAISTSASHELTRNGAPLSTLFFLLKVELFQNLLHLCDPL